MKILKHVIKVMIAGMTSVTLLSVFCLVYLRTGIHIKNETGATDYKWESNQRKASMVEGFTWLAMDKNGFNNSFPVKENIDILLMGSSHMEALNVSTEKNTGYLLNEMMPELYTYNIGISGHSIYTCANNLKAATDYYHPQYYTIIETDRIDLDKESMERVMNGRYQTIQSYDSGVLYLLQKYVPIVKNLYKQVDDWWDSDLIDTRKYDSEKSNVIEADSMPDEYRAALDRFLGFMRDGGGDSKIIIIYQPKTKLNPDGSLQSVSDERKIAVFSQLCKENDILFADATPAFETLYTEHHILAHGFANTAVGVGHLNEYGHKAIAEVLVQAIKEAQ